MSTEERDESQMRPQKVASSGIRRENTDMEGERKPYNQGYARPEGGNYERRPYNRVNPEGRSSYRSYDNQRPAYSSREGGYSNRDNGYGSREGGYGNRPSYGGNRGFRAPNRDNGYGNREGGYGNRDNGYGNRPAYGNCRNYGNNDQRSYNRPSRPSYYEERPVRSYQPQGTGENDGEIKKKRPRVGDAPHMSSGYDNRPMGRPSYGNNRGGGYGNQNRRPMNNRNNNRRPSNNGGYNPNAKYNVQKQLKYKEVLADPNEPIRLNKFLANAGVCSRREADELIQKGLITVNGQVITELGTKITRQDNVVYEGKSVQIESKVYIVLNKPKNCVTTSEDPQERLTVMDLVKNACSERIYPVGRLDRNTTGVLLLTNDGDLASKLTHPAFKKKKIYHVWLDKEVAVEDMEKIANGLELEDGEIHADAISYASETDKKQVGIEIHSGRNRIVRRIFESLGYHVTKLDRVYFAGLTKKNLGRGKWRYLNEKEVNALRMGAFE
ncbi:MAG: pseudouridine synthase [Parabacteroides sp.]